MKNNNNYIIINITGNSRSGKDTTKDVLSMMLCSKLWTKIAIADPVKELGFALGWDGQKDHTGRILLLRIGHALKGNKDYFHYNKEVEENTLLAFIKYYPDQQDLKQDDTFWSLFSIRRIEKIKQEKPYLRFIFITDMRFETEFKLFHKHFDVVYNIRIERKEASALDADKELHTLFYYSNPETTFIIENNGTEQEFIQKIQTLKQEIVELVVAEEKREE